MKIAFIGGTLFIGHHAVERAHDRCHSVFVIHRGKHPCEVEGVSSLIADSCDPTAVADCLQQCSPDAVVDTRAMTKDQAKAMVIALEQLLSPLPLVCLSSQDVYAQFGSLHGHPCGAIESEITEESPLTVPYPFKGILKGDEGDLYDKKEVEREFIEAYQRKVITGLTILRLPATYGPRDPQRRFRSIIECLRRGETHFLCQDHGAWRWTHADVRDVAHAIILAVENIQKAIQIFNVGEWCTPTMKERVESFSRTFGKTVSWEATEGELSPEFFIFKCFPNDVVIDDSKIRKTLGFSEITTPDQRLRGLMT